MGSVDGLAHRAPPTHRPPAALAAAGDWLDGDDPEMSMICFDAALAPQERSQAPKRAWRQVLWHTDAPPWRAARTGETYGGGWAQVRALLASLIMCDGCDGEKSVRERLISSLF